MRRRSFGPIGLLAICPIWLALGGTARGDSIGFTVSFNDSGGTYASYYQRITESTLAAGARWAAHLGGSAMLDVVVRFDPTIQTATGRSLVASYLRRDGTYDLFEQGAAAELRTGVDPNRSLADIEIVFAPFYLANELWFDPDPTSRVASVPFNRTDAVSVLLHEIGHAIGFNGWRRGTDGSLPGTYLSTFDALTIFDGSNLVFVGPQAMAAYGGPVPLTSGNYAHLGNPAPRPGAALVRDLMNGVAFERGARYDISALDLAILSDLGVPMAGAIGATTVPEPSTLATSIVGAIGILLVVRRRQAAGRPGS